MKKTRNKKLFVCLILLLGTLSTLIYLHQQGFFKNPAVALRELKKQNIPATPAQVHQAAKTGNHVTLKLLGHAGVNFLQADHSGKNALHHALSSKHPQLLPTIERFGIAVNQKDHGGSTPLYYALEGKDHQTATWLLKRGSLVDFQIGPEPAVIYYYDTERWDDLSFLLDHGAQVNVKGSDGESLLGRAIQDGNRTWVSRLIHAQAEVNQSTVNGELLISKALKMGRADLVTELLEAGADPNSLTSSGESLLNEIILRWSQTGLTEKEASKIVASLIDHKADLESHNLGGLRPIQSSILVGFGAAQQLLLSKVSSISDCLSIAIELENHQMIGDLLERGADPDEMIGHETALFISIKNGNVGLVNKLISHGASLENLGVEGQKPLVTAIAAGQEEVVIAMLSHQKKPQLDTEMIFPVSEQFRDLFSRKGLFDWYCRNERQLQPIHAAVMCRQLSVVKHLLALGVNKFAETKNKVYPIQMAAANGDIKMQQLLIGVPYQDEMQERNFIIDLSEQKVYYYNKGQIIKTSRISSGRKDFRTPTGNYVITDKTKDKVSNIYHNADMPYFQRFSCSPIGFHEGNTSSRYASHGCIRLPLSVAKYFWGQTKLGDRVTIRD